MIIIVEGSSRMGPPQIGDTFTVDYWGEKVNYRIKELHGGGIKYIAENASEAARSLSDLG